MAQTDFIVGENLPSSLPAKFQNFHDCFPSNLLELYLKRRYANMIIVSKNIEHHVTLQSDGISFGVDDTLYAKRDA